MVFDRAEPQAYYAWRTAAELSSPEKDIRPSFFRGNEPCPRTNRACTIARRSG